MLVECASGSTTHHCPPFHLVRNNGLFNMVGHCSKISLAVLVILVAWTPGYLGSKEEDMLINELFSNYVRLARPGEKDKPLEVSYGLSLMRITNFDFDTDSITTEVWENYEWKDNRLKWNSTRYGIRSLRFPPNLIWMPDLRPYNGWAIRSDLTNVVIYSDGTASWVPRRFFNSPCTLSGKQLDCPLKVGSWTYDGTKLNITNRNTKIDVSNYGESPHYSLIETKAERHVKIYECCPEPYMDITFHMTVGFKKPRDISYLYE